MGQHGVRNVEIPAILTIAEHLGDGVINALSSTDNIRVVSARGDLPCAREPVQCIREFTVSLQMFSTTPALHLLGAYLFS